MPRRIAMAFAVVAFSSLVVTGALAEKDRPAGSPAGAACGKIDRCTPPLGEPDGKPTQNRTDKSRHDTVKNSINNVR